MAKKAPKRGSAEERWYYLTEEGRNSIELGDEFDWHRALELLFEDAPEVSLEHCSMEYFQNLRDAGVITKEECDTACEIGAFMIAHKFCSAQVKTPWYEPILYLLFCSGGVSFCIWFVIIYVVFSTICSCIY